jgi:clan AA aspartic protease (TIGR02281 family)
MIAMENVGGVYLVPIRINDTITLDAIVDSGASDVSMPADVVLTLMRTKTISSEDFMGTQTYTLADGSKVPSQRFQIKSLKVGNKTLENVMASIVPATAQILLGQSFLSRFSSWSIDNEKHALVLN